MSNTDIRRAAAAAGVPHWKIAEYLGISEFTLSRKLRRELNPTEQDAILKAIEILSRG